MALEGMIIARTPAFSIHLMPLSARSVALLNEMMSGETGRML